MDDHDYTEMDSVKPSTVNPYVKGLEHFTDI